jgi:hypothetical protein
MVSRPRWTSAVVICPVAQYASASQSLPKTDKTLETSVTGREKGLSQICQTISEEYPTDKVVLVVVATDKVGLVVALAAASTTHRMQVVNGANVAASVRGMGKSETSQTGKEEVHCHLRHPPQLLFAKVVDKEAKKLDSAGTRQLGVRAGLKTALDHRDVNLPKDLLLNDKLAHRKWTINGELECDLTLQPRRLLLRPANLLHRLQLRLLHRDRG